MKNDFIEFDIDGLIYKVNLEGIVMNSKNEVIKQRITYDGYSIVTLGRNKKRKTYRVHRLVAKAFIPNPNDLDEVNHKDFNKQNNSIENLEWVNHLDNVNHAVKAGRHISQTDITGKNNPNYGNDTLKKYYENNPELKKNLARKGSQNGTAKKVSVYRDEQFIKSFSYIGECAEWLVENNFTKANIKGIRSRITESIKQNATYLGLTFKFD